MVHDHVTRMKRRPLVGMLALSKLVTKDKKKRAVRLVQHLFVLPEWRGRGVGQTLLHQALEANAPLQTTGAVETKSSKNQPLVAVIVRKHASQQAAARRLYTRGGLKGRPIRQGGFLSWQSHNSQTTDALEYREASLPSRHWQSKADAHFPSDYKANNRMIFHNSSGPGEVFVSAHPDHQLVPSEALKRNRAFWLTLKAHHNPANGGDGQDPLAIVAAADYVVPAYNALADGQTIGTIDAHHERLRVRESCKLRRFDEAYNARIQAKMDLEDRQNDYLAKNCLTDNDVGELDSDWDPAEWI